MALRRRSSSPSDGLSSAGSVVASPTKLPSIKVEHHFYNYSRCAPDLNRASYKTPALYTRVSPLAVMASFLIIVYDVKRTERWFIDCCWEQTHVRFCSNTLFETTISRGYVHIVLRGGARCSFCLTNRNERARVHETRPGGVQLVHNSALLWKFSGY